MQATVRPFRFEARPSRGFALSARTRCRSPTVNSRHKCVADVRAGAPPARPPLRHPRADRYQELPIPRQPRPAGTGTRNRTDTKSGCAPGDPRSNAPQFACTRGSALSGNRIDRAACGSYPTTRPRPALPRPRRARGLAGCHRHRRADLSRRLRKARRQREPSRPLHPPPPSLLDRPSR